MSDYWLERTKSRLDNAEKIGYSAMKDILPIYEQALQNINKEINRLYVNYADKAGLDVIELTKVLSGADRENFIVSIQAKMKELGFNVMDVYDPRYIGRLTRLEAMKQQIYWEIQSIAPKELAISEGAYIRIIEESYSASRKDIREHMGRDYRGFAQIGDIQKYQILRENWQGGNYSTRIWTNNAILNNRIEEILPRVIGGGLVSGISQEKMQKQIRESFDVSRYYAMRLVRTETNYFTNQAELQSYEDEGVQYYRYVAILDKRTSHICGDILHNEVFKVSEAQVGFNYPPMHPNSYHKDTEVYTERGFVLVKDVKVGEKVLSLNPKTRDLEWVRVVRTYKHKEPKLYSYQSRNLDLVVTPDHDLLIQKRWNKRTGKRKLEMVKAKDLPLEALFYRSSEWVGSIGNIETFGMPLKVFCEFMGWYLSEGSVARGRVDIKISQERESGVKAIEKMLRKSRLEYTKIKGGFYIRNKKLRKYLGIFGRSYEKFVPEEIKQLPAKYIRIFLDAYNLGDGSMRTSKWKDGNFVPEKTYRTSSKRMADDLGELLVKVGKRPSYYLQEGKGIEVKHRNGIYKGNWDIWVIRECNSQFANTFSKEIIDYNDYVYCVELEKNHTLYVRKNGKCVWSGNCRSSTRVVFDEEAKSKKVWTKVEWQQELKKRETEESKNKE